MENKTTKQQEKNLSDLDVIEVVKEWLCSDSKIPEHALKAIRHFYLTGEVDEPLSLSKIKTRMAENKIKHEKQYATDAKYKEDVDSGLIVPPGTAFKLVLNGGE